MVVGVVVPFVSIDPFEVDVPLVGVCCALLSVFERGRRIAASTSAEPDFEVDARLPCLAMRSREEQIMLLAVLMLKVL